MCCGLAIIEGRAARAPSRSPRDCDVEVTSITAVSTFVEPNTVFAAYCDLSFLKNDGVRFGSRLGRMVFERPDASLVSTSAENALA
jgi:hypothetical protein